MKLLNFFKLRQIERLLIDAPYVHVTTYCKGESEVLRVCGLTTMGAGQALVSYDVRDGQTYLHNLDDYDRVSVAGMRDYELASYKDWVGTELTALCINVNMMADEVQSRKGSYRYHVDTDEKGRKWYIDVRCNFQRHQSGKSHFTIVLYRDADENDDPHPILYKTLYTTRAIIKLNGPFKGEPVPDYVKPVQDITRGMLVELEPLDGLTLTWSEPNFAYQTVTNSGLVKNYYSRFKLKPELIGVGSITEGGYVGVNAATIRSQLSELVASEHPKESIIMGAFQIDTQEFYGEWYPEYVTGFFEGRYPESSLQIIDGVALVNLTTNNSPMRRVVIEGPSHTSYGLLIVRESLTERLVLSQAQLDHISNAIRKLIVRYTNITPTGITIR